MATQYGNVSAYDVHERLRIGLENVARFPVESGAGYEVPNVGLGLRAFGSGWNASQQPRFGLVTVLSGDPNATSSGEASVFDAYRPESGRLEGALSALVAVDEEHAPGSDWLAEALAALAEVDDEIAEEELPPIDGATKTEAKRIIKALARRHPLAPTIYPTQDAEIAIHFKSPDRPDVVVILLNNSGQASCYAYIDGRGRRSHYDTSSDLPDAFVLDQLLRLTPPGRAAASTPDAGFHMFGTTSLLTNLLRTR